jgi:glycerol kinase
MNHGTRMPRAPDGLLSTVAWQVGRQTTYALEAAIFISSRPTSSASRSSCPRCPRRPRSARRCWPAGAGLLKLDQVRTLGDERACYEPRMGEDEREALLDGWHRAVDRSRSG